MQDFMGITCFPRPATASGGPLQPGRK